MLQDPFDNYYCTLQNSVNQNSTAYKLVIKRKDNISQEIIYKQSLLISKIKTENTILKKQLEQKNIEINNLRRECQTVSQKYQDLLDRFKFCQSQINKINQQNTEKIKIQVNKLQNIQTNENNEFQNLRQQINSFKNDIKNNALAKNNEQTLQKKYLYEVQVQTESKEQKQSKQFVQPLTVENNIMFQVQTQTYNIQNDFNNIKQQQPMALQDNLMFQVQVQTQTIQQIFIPKHQQDVTVENNVLFDVQVQTIDVRLQQHIQQQIHTYQKRLMYEVEIQTGAPQDQQKYKIDNLESSQVQKYHKNMSVQIQSQNQNVNTHILQQKAQLQNKLLQQQRINDQLKKSLRKSQHLVKKMQSQNTVQYLMQDPIQIDIQQQNIQLCEVQVQVSLDDQQPTLNPREKISNLFLNQIENLRHKFIAQDSQELQSQNHSDIGKYTKRSFRLDEEDRVKQDYSSNIQLGRFCYQISQVFKNHGFVSNVQGEYGLDGLKEQLQQFVSFIKEKQIARQFSPLFIQNQKKQFIYQKCTNFSPLYITYVDYQRSNQEELKQLIFQISSLQKDMIIKLIQQFSDRWQSQKNKWQTEEQYSPFAARQLLGLCGLKILTQFVQKYKINDNN